MPDTIVQTTLRTTDAVPANFVTNQICIANMAGVDGNEAAITGLIKDFYDTIRSGFFSSDIAQNGHICKFYNAGGPAPNYPYAEVVWNFASAPSGTGLPREVAVCLSFQGLRIPGTPQARRRGRIYLGPLISTINSSGRPAASPRTTLATAASDFGTDVQTVDPAYRWAVWSVLDGTAVPITDGWIDDAFDTQRSRGVETTSRQTFTV